MALSLEAVGGVLQKKLFLRIPQNPQKNNLNRTFLIKLQWVEVWSFIKKRLRHRSFSVNFVKIFKNTYFVEHIQRAASVLFYVSYLGRALLVKVDNFDLGQLAEYALNAGFDWVWYKSSNYLHISVIPDGMCDFFIPLGLHLSFYILFIPSKWTETKF